MGPTPFLLLPWFQKPDYYQLFGTVTCVLFYSIYFIEHGFWTLGFVWDWPAEGKERRSVSLWWKDEISKGSGFFKKICSLPCVKFTLNLKPKSKRKDSKPVSFTTSFAIFNFIFFSSFSTSCYSHRYSVQWETHKVYWSFHLPCCKEVHSERGANPNSCPFLSTVLSEKCPFHISQSDVVFPCFWITVSVSEQDRNSVK